MGSLLQDLRFALRTYLRRPLFTIIALVTLGLGIGTTSALFSVVDGVLLRELPYAEPGTLVSVWEAFPSWQDDEALGRLWDRVQFTHRDYREVRSATRTLTDVALFAGWGEMALTGSGAPQQLSVGHGSANLFQTLGVRPLVGRAFLPGEDATAPGGAARVAVLSYELWQRRFGGDGRILGTSIVLDDEPYTVVGVLPSGFRLESVIVTDVMTGSSDPGLRDLWVPLGQPGLDFDSEGNAFEALARLAPDVTLERARAEIEAILAFDPNMPEREARVAPRKEVVTRGFAAPLMLNLAAAALLLLIACANVATLLIGEATGRRHEIATRSALGAGRLRVARQLLTESVVLGLLGSLVGILIAMAATRILVHLAPPIPRLEEVEVSLRVIAFAAAAGLGTALVFGLAPLAVLARGSVGSALAARGRGTTGRDRSFQGAVVSLQVALTVMLLVAGGLLARSLVRLLAVDPGFEVENLATFELVADDSRYPARADVSRFFADVVRSLGSVPGVVSVAGSYGLPFPGGAPLNGFRIEARGAEGDVVGRRRTVLPGYHETLGIPLLAGRFLSEADDADAPGAIVISESMARRFWPDASPLGATVLFWNSRRTIVGIVGDVRHTTLSTEGEPTFYVPFEQAPRRNLNLVMRTAGDPAGLLPLLREAVWAVDPDMPIGDEGTISASVTRSAADNRYRTLLVLAFGSLAALLAAVGIFGVTARGVAQRTRELGIRLALGARQDELVGLILRHSLVIGLAGTGLGLLGAAWASRLLSYYLFSIEPWDPLTYGAVGALSVLVCLAASYLPARRAAGLAPMEVLRQE
jgi:predicted permease